MLAVCVCGRAAVLLDAVLQAAASMPPESGFAAKLCFAHAETIIPLACLLGLFGPTPPAAEASRTVSAEQCSQADVQRHTVSEHTQSALSSEPVMQHHEECGISGSAHSRTDSSNTGTCDVSNASTSSSSSSDSEAGSFPRELMQEGGDEGGQAWVPPLSQPPVSRDCYGSMIAPYGANVQFALHRCTDSQVSRRGIIAWPYCASDTRKHPSTSMTWYV